MNVFARQQEQRRIANNSSRGFISRYWSSRPQRVQSYLKNSFSQSSSCIARAFLSAIDSIKRDIPLNYHKPREVYCSYTAKSQRSPKELSQLLKRSSLKMKPPNTTSIVHSPHGNSCRGRTFASDLIISWGLHTLSLQLWREIYVKLLPIATLSLST